jgi:hypothetical protein
MHTAKITSHSSALYGCFMLHLTKIPSRRQKPTCSAALAAIRPTKVKICFMNYLQKKRDRPRWPALISYLTTEKVRILLIPFLICLTSRGIPVSQVGNP